MPFPPLPSPHPTADPESLAASAAALRRLSVGGSPQAGTFPVPLDDDHVPAVAGDSGIGRFLAALSSAARAQQTRVGALADYADGAAGAIDWFTGAVDDVESASSGRLGRDGEAMA